MTQRTIETEIAIIGGGLGGVAAALAAAESGRRVVISEPTDWIGGQVTSQAVSALDEHHYIETFGGTRSYYRFRDGVRAVYQSTYGAPERMPSTTGVLGAPLNPGNGWVSRLCFEPRVGLRVLVEMLSDWVSSGRVQILLEHSPVSARVQAGCLQSVTLAGPGDSRTQLRAAFFLDATELGDLLALAGAPYVTGAEAVEDTGEPHASPDGPHPERAQSFTCAFLVEHCPGEDHTIRKPRGYEYARDEQPFTLVLRTRGGGVRRFLMFEGELPFWTYRRVFDAGLLSPGRRDIALINWDSNDYYRESLIDRSPAQQARILSEAKQLSLSFLYWLQTECPRDGGNSANRGYPGLRLLPRAVGTRDGLAKAPYIRESRRMLGLRRVLEQDIIAQPGRGARSEHFADSVGVGWYPIDLHRCAGDPTAGRETRIDFDPSLPFHIPLGALISPAVENLVAAAKNISTTHITNGAYRLHPVEWNVGEAAGALAAFCLDHSLRPRAVWNAPDRLRSFQCRLLARGVPLAWGVDAGLDDPDFRAIQSCLVAGPPPEGSPRRELLEIRPEEQVSRREADWLLGTLPHAAENASLALLLDDWRGSPYGPLTGEDWFAACHALNLPAPAASEYPTLREVCRKLALFV